MVVCYLSNSKMQVMEGKRKNKNYIVERVRELSWPAELFTANKEEAKERFIKIVRDFGKANRLANKEVSLIVEDKSFISKMIEVPIMSEKELLAYIPKEFSDVENRKESIYGYTILGTKDAEIEKKKVKLLSIFAVSADREFVDKLLFCLKKAGMKVNHLSTVMGSNIRITNQLPEIQGKTCLVQLMDGASMTNILYVKGKYQYSNRTRLYSEVDTPGYGVEIARSVSNIIQFAKAQQIEEKITDIFVGGISPDTLTYMEEGVYQIDDSLNVDWLSGAGRVQFLDAALQLSDTVSLVGGFSPVQGKGNLYVQWKQNKKKQEERKKTLISLIPVFAVGIVVVAVLIVVALRAHFMNKSYEELTAFLNNDVIVTAVERYDTLAADNNQMLAECRYLEVAEDAIATYPTGEKEVLDRVKQISLGLTDVEFISFDSETGALSMEVTASEVEHINQFIGKLTEETIFADVAYTGYTMREEYNDWSVNVSCILAASAGRE